MPPTLLQSCSHDILNSENIAFVNRLKKSGAKDVRHSYLERSEHCETINADYFKTKMGKQGYGDVKMFILEMLQ